MKKTIVTLLILVAVFVAWSAWPFFGLYDIGRSLQAGDVAQLEREVDFPALRRSFAAQIVQAYGRLTGVQAPSGFTAGVASAFADALVAKLISPEALAELLRGRLPKDVPADRALSMSPLDWNALGSVWRLYALSDYGIGEVRLLLPADAPADKRFRVHLELQDWTWKLAGLDLPAETQDQLARVLIKERGATVSSR